MPRGPGCVVRPLPGCPLGEGQAGRCVVRADAAINCFGEHPWAPWPLEGIPGPRLSGVLYISADPGRLPPTGVPTHPSRQQAVRSRCRTSPPTHDVIQLSFLIIDENVLVVSKFPHHLHPSPPLLTRCLCFPLCTAQGSPMPSSSLPLPPPTAVPSSPQTSPHTLGLL